MLAERFRCGETNSKSEAAPQLAAISWVATGPKALNNAA